jgi:hypothetical protein
VSSRGSSSSFWASLAIVTARVPSGEVDRGCNTTTKVTTTILIVSGFSHQPQIVVDGVTNVTTITDASVPHGLQTKEALNKHKNLYLS